MNKEQLKNLDMWFNEEQHELIIQELTKTALDKLEYELTGHLARAYNNVGQYGKAIILLSGVRDEGETDSLWHYRLGYAYYYAGREEEALRYFENAYRLDPTDEQAKMFIQSIGDILGENQGMQNTVVDEEALLPFRWVAHASSVSLILNAGSYKNEVFAGRIDEGFEGNGYDWGSLAAVFIDEVMPDLEGRVHFDPEADMFCAYSEDGESLKQFALGFKAACEDDVLIRDLFSRSELD
ncbi:Imm51 family immunity protein [Sporosarcina sp. FSL K6-1522]|uniref:Imm51 family immunity protein n=1 Tax=Sporosarcina sp. FSL K6-1522 TaxID=2921554 RepID=UPI003159ED61